MAAATLLLHLEGRMVNNLFYKKQPPAHVWTIPTSRMQRVNTGYIYLQRLRSKGMGDDQRQELRAKQHTFSWQREVEFIHSGAVWRDGPWGGAAGR